VQSAVMQIAEGYNPFVADFAAQRLRLDAGAIDLLKCDIEGAERELFERCASWITRVRLIAIEVHAPFVVGELMSLIAAAGGEFELLSTSRQGRNPLCLLRNCAD